MLKLFSFISILLFLFAFSSCSSNSQKQSAEEETEYADCDYNKLEITLYEFGTDKIINSKTTDACLFIQEFQKEMGGVEIKDPDGIMKISYYNESDPKILKFLDVSIKGKDTWRLRANKGHDLFKNEEEGKLTLVFGDRDGLGFKGTIVLTK
ncbi:DUF1406 domain-containing protein [Bernardetia sp. ABR2-2B]|uniref:SECRET domain-containing protein n=1 Tax=Bernardetia sp. ABR2-2B TaxID=3127472 RepID=UPI0030CB9D71